MDARSDIDTLIARMGEMIIARGEIPDMPLIARVRNNYNPVRSGNVYVVFQPGRFINDMDGLSVAVTQGSRWRYDTYVPIIFAGAGLVPGKIDRPVETVDVATTLARIAGTAPPSGAAGNPLPEVLEALRAK